MLAALKTSESKPQSPSSVPGCSMIFHHLRSNSFSTHPFHPTAWTALSESTPFLQLPTDLQ